MSQHNEGSVSPPLEPTPPMNPIDDLVWDEPPGWPKVVGGISIGWAALGLTCAGCGVAGMAFMTSGSLPGMEGPLPPPMVPTPLTWIFMLLSFAPPILLLAAGIVTMSRKPVGRPLHLVYAVIAIVMTAVGVWFQLQQQAAMEAWIQQNPDSPWAQQQNAPGAQMGQIAGLIVGIIAGFAWPIFCLVWFGLIKTKPEDFTGNAPAPAA